MNGTSCFTPPKFPPLAGLSNVRDALKLPMQERKAMGKGLQLGQSANALRAWDSLEGHLMHV